MSVKPTSAAIRGKSFLTLALTGLALMMDFHAVGVKLWSSIIAVVAGVAWMTDTVISDLARIQNISVVSNKTGIVE